MEREDIFRSLPHQPRLVSGDPSPAELKVRKITYPKAPWWLVIWRGLQWQLSIVIYMLSRAKDALVGDKSDARKGQRLRELFERVGGTGIKIGQQLAMRVDFFPYAVCQELERLLDSVKPFPVEQALKRIEASLGRPAAEIFAEIEPEPIGSASIACVWAATLRSGERVAVKVQRPDIERRFVADIELVAKFTRLLEALSVVRPGFLENLRNEMRDMFLTELDFIQEANFQIMFARLTKRAKLRWVKTPKVYVEYSSAHILTTQFVTGYLATDVLKAIETNDEEVLQKLSSDDIDPRKVGQRILSLSYWSRMECFFFHSDPHPGNIFIIPGNKLVLIDFGSCGVNYSYLADSEFEMTRRLLIGDIPGAAQAGLPAQAPLPAIDVDRFVRVITRLLFHRYIDTKSKQAEWWERTTASMWISIIETTRDFNIPANVNTLRLIRSSMLYDTLAFRFNPDVDFIKTFRRWSKAAQKRGRRSARRQRQRAARDRIPRAMQNIGDMRETLERGSFWSSQFMNTLPKQFVASAGQAAYVFSMLIRLGLTYLLVSLLGVMAVFLYLAVFGEVSIQNIEQSMSSMVQHLVTHPIAIVIAFLFLFQSLGRIQKKLREKK